MVPTGVSALGRRPSPTVRHSPVLEPTHRASAGAIDGAQLIRHRAREPLRLVHCQYTLSPKQFWCHVNEATSQPWYVLYADTVRELDRNLLLEGMAATEAAIESRLYDLRHDSDHHAERQAIDDAIRNLTLIRRCCPFEDA